MHRHYSLRSKRWVKWGIGLLLFAAGCAEPPATAQVPVTAPPVPAGQARIWFYRSWEPSESLNLANINVNGSYFGSVANGGAFYRDVPPGHYYIAPESYGRDFNQDTDVGLTPGQQLYVKVLSLRSWQEGGDVNSFERDTEEADTADPSRLQRPRHDRPEVEE